MRGSRDYLLSFPALLSSSESTRFKGVARVSSFPFRGFAVLSLLLKVFKPGLNFPFEISTFFHSLECILSVIWSISALLAFDPILGSKAVGVPRI